jgi:hypothetical protein
MALQAHFQEMADLFAALAAPRLHELLKLKSAEHVYDPQAARAPATSVVHGREIAVDKWIHTTQPYRNIERFVADERVMTYIVDPGLIPLVKALLLDVRGRRWLVTRKLAPRDPAENASAHLDGFGIRIALKFDAATQETQVLWECLYGVA